MLRENGEARKHSGSALFIRRGHLGTQVIIGQGKVPHPTGSTPWAGGTKLVSKGISAMVSEDRNCLLIL